jgi:hypothetical protein
MKLKSLIISTVLFMAWSLPLSLSAEETPAVAEKPSFSATQKVQVTTRVEVINHETHQVTLRGPQGKLRTINAGENAKNLDQIEVGDRVNVEYLQHMSIEVFANDGTEPGTGIISAAGKAAEGENPGAMVMETRVATATVEEINLEDNTFKLKWPGDEIKQYVAQDPENLRKAAVGDLVVTTYTEAFAIYLNEVPAE